MNTFLRVLFAHLHRLYHDVAPNADQPSRNTVDQGNLLYYSAQALSSLLSNVALSLEENRTSLDENIRADKLALTSLHKRKTCLQSAVKGNITNEIYDFVIIGYGNTGQSALRTLRKECPHARIALVDPLRSSKRGRKKSSKSSTNIEHYRDTVVEFDTSKKSVKLLTDQNTHIVYRHGLMIATARRPLPWQRTSARGGGPRGQGTPQRSSKERRHARTRPMTA